MARKGQENLIPLDKRTKEAQRKIQSMGGIASRDAKRRVKDLREALQEALGIVVPSRNGGELTIAQGIAQKTARKALDGDPKALQQIIDLLYGRKQEVDVKSSDGSMSPMDVTVKFVKPKPEE